MIEPLDLNVCITKETTDISYLLSNPDFLHDLAQQFRKRDEVTAICRAHQCSNCPLDVEHFNDDLSNFAGDRSCTAYRYFIIGLDIVKEKFTSGRNKADVCENCTHCTKQGVYDYCTAWHNFTTKEMYCGYFEKTLDK